MNQDASQPGAETLTATLQPGAKLGNYRIVEQLGAGGTSVVYKGRDDLLGRDVAVKQVRLSGEPDDEALRRSVTSEAHVQKQAAAAEPDRLVQLIDVVDEQRGLFLISEFVDGSSLEQELARNPEPMDIKRAVGILAATAQALAAIHARKIIHRDLKPGNILLTNSGGLKIADFGLATSMSEQQLMSLGSVRYMAPELLRGEAADGRADLYALGIIAYEMLAGRRQFDSAFRMVVRDQRNQAMRWVKWHTNPRAKVAPIRELRNDVPDAIGELVDRLMDKSPDRRVPTAHDVVEAIRRHYAGEAPDTASAGSAMPPPPTATAPDPAALSGGGDTAPVPKRSKTPIVLTALLLLWVLVAGGIAFFMVQQEGSAREQAQQQARQNLRDAQQTYRQGNFSEALNTYQQLTDNWPESSTIGRHARAGMLLTEGRLSLEREEYDNAREKLRQLEQMNIADGAQVRDLLEEAENRGAFSNAMERIEQLIGENQFGQARQQLRQWRGLALTSEEEDRLEAVSAKLEDQQVQREREQVLDRANQLAEQGQRNEAISLLEEALERAPSPALQQRLDELSAGRTYDQAVADAEAAEAAGEFSEAIGAYREALTIRQNEQIEQKLKSLQSQAALREGLRLLNEGKPDEAEAALMRSLRYEDNPQAREALANIETTSRRLSFIRDGDEAFASGDYEAAIAQYRNAMKLGTDEQLEDKLSQARLRRLVERGRAAIRDDRLDEAGERLDTARQIDASDTELQQATRQLEVHRQYHKHLAAGDAARERSDFGRAIRAYNKAREIIDTEEVRQLRDAAEYADAIAKARAYMEAEEYVSARAWLQNAAKIRQSEEVKRLFSEVEQQMPAPTP